MKALDLMEACINTLFVKDSVGNLTYQGNKTYIFKGNLIQKRDSIPLSRKRMSDFFDDNYDELKQELK